MDIRFDLMCVFFGVFKYITLFRQIKCCCTVTFPLVLLMHCEFDKHIVLLTIRMESVEYNCIMGGRVKTTARRKGAGGGDLRRLRCAGIIVAIKCN